MSEARTNPQQPVQEHPDDIQHKENGREVVRYEHPEEKLTTVTSENPIQVIHNAKAVADELKKIIDKARLTQRIGSKDHVKIEGWTSMLAMLGVAPVVVSNKRLDREGETIYEGTVELRSRDGRIVGRGEAICSSKERNWNNRDEYAIKSMAATRATGKAARLSFSWIMTLAGYDPTPLEEIPIHEAETVTAEAVKDTGVFAKLSDEISAITDPKQKAGIIKKINDAYSSGDIDTNQKQQLIKNLNKVK